MITSEERKIAFKKDLNELLLKHGAEIMLEEENSHGWERGLERMVVTMMNKFDENGCTHEYTELILGRFISGEE